MDDSCVYLNVSLWRDVVFQALYWCYQEGTMILQDLDYSKHLNQKKNSARFFKVMPSIYTFNISFITWISVAPSMSPTSFKPSWVIALKDRITPMMVILFRTFSPPGSTHTWIRLHFSPDWQPSIAIIYDHLWWSWYRVSYFLILCQNSQN